MFERAQARVRAAAAMRTRARVAELAERMQSALPSGIAVEAGPEGVRLSGPGLAARFALDPALRWLALELIK